MCETQNDPITKTFWELLMYVVSRHSSMTGYCRYNYGTTEELSSLQLASTQISHNTSLGSGDVGDGGAVLQGE